MSTTTVLTENIELVFVCEHCRIQVDVNLIDFAVLGEIPCGECGVSMDMSDAVKVAL